MRLLADVARIAIRELRRIVLGRLRSAPVSPPSQVPPRHDGTDRCGDGTSAAPDFRATVASAEAALRNSERLYRHVFDHMPISMWHFDLRELAEVLKESGADEPVGFDARVDQDPDFLFRLMDAVIAEDVNDYTVRLFRARERGELLGRCGFLWRASPDVFRRVIASRVRGDHEYQVETRFIAFDGRPLDVLFSLSRLGPAETQRCIVWLVDITERTRAQEELQRLQAEAQATLDSIPALAWRTSADGFTEYLNKPWLEYAGFSLEQALGWGWVTAIHPDDREGLLKFWTAKIALKQAGTVEARMRRSDGTYRWFMFHTQPVCDASGAVIAWYGTNSDIEDRKHAEAALRRNEAYAAEAQRLSRTGAFAWEISSGDTFWSDETYQILGLDRSVTPSRELLLSRVHPDDRELMRRERDRLDQGLQDRYDYELRLLMPDGHIKHLHLLAHRVIYGSNKMEVVGALMDVTQAKRSQQALHAAQNALAHAGRVATLGEITATIAHEVNQPLAAVITNAETSLRWLDRPEPNLAKVRELIGFLLSDARRASGIIDRIRSMATRGTPNPTSVSLNDVIQESMIFLRHEFQSRGVSVALELMPGLPPIIGDRIQIQQVIVNLAINAAQAMEQSGPTERNMIVKTLLAAPEAVSCSIEDGGTGIDSAHFPRLFDSLFTTKDSGIGLGLAISRSIIEAHHGNIQADNQSALGGARFSFTLPVGVASQVQHGK